MTMLDKFTFYLPPRQREAMFALASAQGVTMGEWLRQVIAREVARVRDQEEETTP